MCVCVFVCVLLFTTGLKGGLKEHSPLPKDNSIPAAQKTYNLEPKVTTVFTAPCHWFL